MIALIDCDVYIDANGYARHGNNKYVHRSIAEAALGRPLSKKERVHHVDYDRTNNTPSNLVICPDDKYHQLLHARQRIIELGGHPDRHHYCSYHKQLHEKSAFSTNRTWSGLHNTCRAATNEYRKNRGLNRREFTWMDRLAQQYRRVFSGATSRAICKINPREESL